MMKICKCFLLPPLFLIYLLFARLSVANSVPNYDDLFVNDYANLLSVSEEKRIRTKLQQVKDKSGVEITVLTISSYGDYGQYSTIETFATKLFNTWGIGDKDKNDGVLILVAKIDREMRIELGKGYSRSRDDDAKMIIDYVMIPRFKKGDFNKGIELGVDSVISQFVPGKFSAIQRVTSDTKEKRWSIDYFTNNWSLALIIERVKDNPALLVILAPFLIIIYFIIYLIRQFFRNKPRYCDFDSQRMKRLTEIEDDNHLSGAQILEEALKSVDYDVWVCESCARMKIEGYSNWFSRYKSCGGCGSKTMSSTATVIEHATTTSEGKKRIDYLCENCQAGYTAYRTIPRESDRDSSSSSSGSFGGGSSSGGGASGRW